MALHSLRFYLLCFLAAFACTACNDRDNEDCDPSYVEVRSLEEEYGCPATPFGISVDVEDDFIIISSQDEYDALVSGTCNAVVDYEVYDLIIGRQQTTGTLTEINYTYRRVCPGNRFELVVVILTTSSPSTPILTYHALVPKIGEGQAVDLVVEV